MRRSENLWFVMSLVVGLIAMAQTTQLAAQDRVQRESPKKKIYFRFESQKANDTQASRHLVPVEIVEQQPAGLLVFKGALDVPLNDAIGVINVAGTIRKTDIQPNGTFSATKVANLSITIQMKKEVARTTRFKREQRQIVTRVKKPQPQKTEKKTDPLIGRQAIIRTARAGVEGTYSGIVMKVTSDWIVLKTGVPIAVDPIVSKVPYVNRLFKNTGVAYQTGEQWIPRDTISSITFAGKLEVPQRIGVEFLDD
ncbi:MAG: flagellar basal body L-ring protein FlgH [Planctomycetaceae bacterium]